MFTRRSLLHAGLAAVGTVTLSPCASRETSTTSDLLAGFIGPDGVQVRDVEAARRPGPVREFTLTAAPTDLDLAGRTLATWAYDGRIPGRELRVTAGEQVRAVVANQLPAATTAHWHGLTLRNNADGVPGVTQSPIASGERFTYQFTASHPGTYWLHPHVGVQLDRGLYAPLIVEDPHEPLAYDHDWVLVLDDWIDGTGTTPDKVLAKVRTGMGGMSDMEGMHHGGDSGDSTGMATNGLLGGDAGDVTYPYFLINGRPSADPQVLQARPGDRVRLRIINAGADTAFRFAVGGHRLQVTHTDGFPIEPVDTDALLIGMGERYDAILTLCDGAFGVVALAEGKQGGGYAIIRTGAGAAPAASARPAQLDGQIIGYRQLRAADPVRLPDRAVDTVINLRLTGGMMNYDWGINGRTFDPSRVDAPVKTGQRVRLNFVNQTTMFHPMHLHGHSFALGGAAGPRKDTAIVLPGQTMSALFDANNPGLWVVHCHNIYHAETGMMALLGYQV